MSTTHECKQVENIHHLQTRTELFSNTVNRVEKDLEELKADMKEIKQKLETFASKEDISALTKLIEWQQSKFASKWVETFFMSIVSVVTVAIVGAILALVLK